jgi:diadenosine tetraphosphate (Ap4A) HIT family hydrolase
MTDLAVVDRAYLMEVVFAVESVIRQLYSPDKINLASFGNMTPHMHWHVIPRWSDDRHFPLPVWGLEQRQSGAVRADVSLSQLLESLRTVLDAIEAKQGELR